MAIHPNANSWLVSWLLLLSSLTATAGNSDWFKNQLLHPQQMELMILKSRQLYIPEFDPTGARNPVDLLSEPKFQLFAWKEDAFLRREEQRRSKLQEPIASSESTAPLSFIGRVGEISWSFVHTNLFITTNIVNGARTNPIQGLVEILEGDALLRATMGFQSAKALSIIWISNNFTATFSPPLRTIQGTITVSNDWVTMMELRRGEPAKSFRKCSYYYATNAQHWPTRVEVSDLLDKGFTPTVAWDILSTKEADGALSDSHFLPTNFIDTNLLLLSYYYNGNAFDVISNRAVRIPTALERAQRRPTARKDGQAFLRRLVLLAMYVTATAGLCFYVWKFHFRKQTTNQKTSTLNTTDE